MLSPNFLKALRAHHPRAKIVLHTRDIDDHIASINRWKDLRVRMVKSDLPFLSAGRGYRDPELATWIRGHYKRVRTMFADDPNFLEISIVDSDAKTKLEGFLKLDLPWWGVANANPKGTDDEV